MATPPETGTAGWRSRERYRRIALSSIAGFLSMGVSALVGLAFVPVLLSYLGKETYGLFAVAGSMAAWVGLFDPGLIQSVVIALSEAHGREDRAAAREYLSTAFFALLAISVVVVVVVLAASPLVPWATLFDVPPSIPPGTARGGFSVAIAVAALCLPVALVPQAYAGYQKAYVASAFTTGGALLSLVLLGLAVVLRAPFPVVVGISGSATLLAGASSLAWLSSREMPWLAPRRDAVSRRAFRRLLSSAVPLYLFQLGALLVNQTQRPVLAHRAGLGIVAEYDILIRIYAFATLVVTATSASMAPAFRESWERGDHGWVRGAFARLVLFRVGAGILGSAVLVVFGNSLLRVWLRRPDFQFPTGVWLALSAYVVVALWGSSFFELLTILDRIWPQVWVVILQGIATVLLTWVVGGRLGVLGALGAVALPTLAVSGFVIPALGTALLRRRP